MVQISDQLRFYYNIKQLKLITMQPLFGNLLICTLYLFLSEKIHSPKEGENIMLTGCKKISEIVKERKMTTS